MLGREIMVCRRAKALIEMKLPLSLVLVLLLDIFAALLGSDVLRFVG